MTAPTIATRPVIALAALSVALCACSGTSQVDLASASRSAAATQAHKDAVAQQATAEASLKAEVDKLKAAAAQSASRSSSASSTSRATTTPSPGQTPARSTRTTHAVAPYVDPVAVVQKYYSDLNSKDFRAAWNAGGYNCTNGGSYSSWVAGYANTTGVIGTARDIGGGVVSTEFSAVHLDGSVVKYAGTYTVRGDTIVSAHMRRVG